MLVFGGVDTVQSEMNKQQLLNIAELKLPPDPGLPCVQGCCSDLRKAQQLGHSLTTHSNSMSRNA